ncbi:MAG: oxidoreductase [Bacillota bacterium]
MQYPTEVTLAGASGLVGHELLLILSELEQISGIKAISRTPLGRLHPKTENFILDFNKIEDHAAALTAPVFICCLGTTIAKAGNEEAFRAVDYEYVMKFARIAEQCHAEKLLVISAMGANPQSKIFYNRIKGEMERELRTLKIPQIEIFRPSLILGERKEHRKGEDIAKFLSPFINPLLLGPLKKYRAIEAIDIAKAMAIATLNFNKGLFIYESDEIQNICDLRS